MKNKKSASIYVECRYIPIGIGTSWMKQATREENIAKIITRVMRGEKYPTLVDRMNLVGVEMSE